VTVFVGNLEYSATDREIRNLFSNYGTVVDCFIPVERDTGRRRGFAFVTLSSNEDETEAISDLDGRMFLGRPLRVNLKNRNDAPPQRPNALPLTNPNGGLNHAIHSGKNIADDVPMEYRAQYKGRCQRHFVCKKPKNAIEWLDSQAYVREWLAAIAPSHPYSRQKWQQSSAQQGSTQAEQTSKPFILFHEVEINWRLISNSGIDEGFIRPVIGPGGWPLIPGSSIKGLFRRACTSQEDQKKWCGMVSKDKEITAGILRFHGAWPIDADWGETMLDLTHPQCKWQVGFNNGGEAHNAIAVVSLLHPTLIVAISSSEPLSKEEWDRVQFILESALAKGLGGRTAAGYGLPTASLAQASQSANTALLSIGLQGQGPASKLLDGTTEVRPTMFRGSIRSMALRLFGGLTDANNAEDSVNRLFGGFGKRGSVYGPLSCYFINSTDPIFERRGDTTACKYEGRLVWRLTSAGQQFSPQQIDQLRDLLTYLHALVMALGGFGPGWRRPGHSFFLKGYTTRHIGCHWQWLNPHDFAAYIPSDAPALKTLIVDARKCAAKWLGVPEESMDSSSAPWREVIHPSRMMIWYREMPNRERCASIKWTHQPTKDVLEHPPQGSMARNHRKPTDLRNTDLGGLSWVPNTNPNINKRGFWTMKVGRIWIKMLPMPDNTQIEASDYAYLEAFPSNGHYLEILTCFPVLSGPDRSPLHRQFANAMDNGGNCGFTRLWPEIGQEALRAQR